MNTQVLIALPAHFVIDYKKRLEMNVQNVSDMLRFSGEQLNSFRRTKIETDLTQMQTRLNHINEALKGIIK